MGYFDYSREPKSDIAFVDMKSFYASVECVERGLHPLKTSLCVMSRVENANGLILASSPMFKKGFGKNNVSRFDDLPFDIKTRKFNYYVARRQGQPITLDYVRFIEEWAGLLILFRLAWTCILRRIWKSNIFSKTTLAQMTSSLILLMRDLLTSHRR